MLTLALFESFLFPIYDESMVKVVREGTPFILVVYVAIYFCSCLSSMVSDILLIVVGVMHPYCRGILKLPLSLI